MKDRYKILNDYPNYRIYDDGRIFSIKQNKFLKPHDDGRGYLDVVLYRGKKEDRKAVKIHVLVARLFVPNPYNNREVNHIDGNKQNNHYTNLEWCTRSYNVRYDLKRRQESAQNNSPLNLEMVKLIPILMLYGCSIKLISIMYNVGHVTIRNIIKGKTWRNLNLKFPNVPFNRYKIELPIEIYNKLKSFNVDNTVLSNRIIPIDSVTHRH